MNIFEKVQNYWTTKIIDMRPGKIRIHGKDIEDLIGKTSFTQMIWLMLRGTLPTIEEEKLFEATLVAAVDHGPQAPVIAVARMAVSSGASLNNAMASAINILGNIHGGVGEECLELMQEARKQSVEQIIKNYKGEYFPGFGHRFHTIVDPRVPRLMKLTEEAEEKKTIKGDFRSIGLELEKQLGRPMNIGGASAVILGELGFEPPLTKGIFALSRSVGVLAHAWEQMKQGERIKGPTPPEFLWKYKGKNPYEDE